MSAKFLLQQLFSSALLMGMLLLISAPELRADCTIPAGDISGIDAGCTGVATIAAGTTVTVNADFTLPAGVTKLVIAGTLDFSNNTTLSLPAGIVIEIIAPGALSIAPPCSATMVIEAGSSVIATCNGGAGAPASFADLNAAGGYNLPVPVTLSITAPADANCGDAVTVTVAVTNFTNLGSLEFSVNWDPAALDFVSEDFSALPGAGVLSAVTPATGEYVLTWIDDDPDFLTYGKSLADGTVILTIDFTVTGSTGTTSVSLSDTPTPRDASDAAFANVPVMYAPDAADVDLTSPAFSFTGNGDSSIGDNAVNVSLCSGGEMELSAFVASSATAQYHEVRTATPGLLYGASPIGNGTQNISAAAAPGYFGNTYGPYNNPTSTPGTITQVITPYQDLNGNNQYDAGIDCAGTPVTLTITVKPVPALVAELNGVSVTSNNDGTPDVAALSLCNNGTVAITNNFSDLAALSGPTVRVFQTVTRTNVNPVGWCNNCQAALNLFTTNESITASLIDPSLPGTIVITFQAWQDFDGNMAISSDECAGDIVEYTINVLPSPILSFCPNNITANTSNDGTGDCATDVIWANPTVAPACAPVTLTYSIDGGTPVAAVGDSTTVNFEKGTYLISYLSMDGGGNTDTCSFTVTVNDNEAPTISCVANQTRDTDLGECDYTVQGTEFDPTFGDNCPMATIENDYNNADSLAGAVFPKGETTVVWTVTDMAGNTATCTITVTVEDNEAPTLTCPADVVANTDPGECTWISPAGSLTPTFDDNCATDTVAWEIEFSTGTFEPPATLAYWAQNNNAFPGGGFGFTPASFPQAADLGTGNLTLENFLTTTGGANGAYTSIQSFVGSTVNAQAGFPAGGSLSPQGGTGLANNGMSIRIAVSTMSHKDIQLSWAHQRTGTGFNSVQLAYSTNGVDFTDFGAPFNPPTSFALASFDFSAIPALNNNPNATFRITLNGATSVSGNNRYDNILVTGTPIGGGNTITGTGDASGTIFPKGVSVVTYTVTDMSGNEANCTFTVTVNDNEAPTIDCSNIDPARNNDPGLCSFTMPGTGFDPASFGDNCPMATIANDFNGGTSLAGETFPVGTTTVIWTVTDMSGNTTSCTIDIVITDNELPVVQCFDQTVTFDGELTIPLVVDDLVEAMDNCGIDTIVLDPAEIECIPLGTIVPVDVTVTATVTDVNGNEASCESTITRTGLPCGWSQSNVGCSGTSSFDVPSQVFTVNSDNCFYGSPYTKDQLAFVKRTLCGNGSITAQVTSITGQGWAGIVIRDNSDPNARKAQLMTNLNAFNRREVRTTTGGNSFPQNFTAQGRYWLRLVRQGNQVIGYASTNGVSWVNIMVAGVTLNTCVEVGLVVTNVNSFSSATATFANVNVVGAMMLDGGDMAQVAQNEGAVQSLNAYPNPTSGQVTLDVSSFMDQRAVLTVQDAFGRTLRSENLGTLENATEQLDLSGVPAGVYYLRLRLEDGKEYVQRIVVAQARP